MNKQLLSELQSNYRLLSYVVNNIFSIKELMGETKNKGIYCPFHGESRQGGSKPSARFYDNQFPIKLWCFSEHKSYYSFQYIQKIMKRSPLQYLIANSTEKKIKYFIEEFKEKSEEEIETLYDFKSLEEIDQLYNTLDSSKDYSKWYIV